MSDKDKKPIELEDGQTRQLNLDPGAQPTVATPATGTPPLQRRVTAFLPGEVLADRFRVVRFIGRGGMGEVYEAFDLELDERVALKTILPAFAAQSQLVERFKREIQLSRQVTHRNVCRIFDLFRHRPKDHTENDHEVLFLSMEFLEGVTLNDHLRQHPALPPEEALPMLQQMAAALDAAHQAGIVHRDFKTANVMLVQTSGGAQVKVTDFGLARNLNPEDEHGLTLTGAGHLVGTPEYMAPEQVRGTEITAAADIYALGIVIFEMVTGVRPFKGDTPLSTATKRLEEPPPSPCSVMPNLPAPWERTILRCLKKDPEDRYSSASEAIRDLVDDGSSAQPKRRLWPYAAACIAALLAAIFIIVSQRNESKPPSGSAQTNAVKARTSVAVLGFSNLSGRADCSWIATALAEMVHTEIGAGGDLRTVDQDTIAAIRRDHRESMSGITIPDAETLNSLRTDFVVIGGYTAIGQEPDLKLRVDIKVYDITSRNTVATVSETGSVNGLFDLVARLGEELRGRLGGGLLTESQAATARQGLPSDIDAARLYSEGLEKIRSLDALSARDLLLETLKITPDYAPAHAAIASAWLDLGYDREAREAASRALELAGNLNKPDRLEIEALAKKTRWDRDGELAIRQTLFTFYPDNPEYGLALAQTQVLAGKSKDALLTVAALRSLPEPSSHDPRIDLREAEARDSLGELESVVEIATRVVIAADARSAPLLGARALLAKGRALGNLGKVDEGEIALLEACERYRNAGDIRGVGQSFNVLGGLAVSAGKPAEGLSYFEQAMENYRTVGDRRGEARALGNTGVVYRRTGKSAEALQAFTTSAETCGEIGDLSCEGKAYENLGNLLRRQGKVADAQRHFELALEIFETIGDRSEQAQVLSNLAVLSMSLGEFDEAETKYNAALLTFRQIGDQKKISMVLNNLAIVLRDRGNLAGARSRWEEALELKEASGDLRGAAIVRLNLGQLVTIEGDPRSAVNLFTQANEALRELANQSLLAEGLLALGKTHIMTADFKAAVDVLEELEPLCKALDEDQYTDRNTYVRALLDFERGNRDGLVNRLRPLLDRLEKHSDPEVETSVRTTLIRVLLAEDRVPEAKTEIEWARAAAEKCGGMLFLHQAAVAEAAVLVASDNSDGATTILQAVIREAAGSGYVSSSLQARLGIARIEIMKSETSATLVMIKDLRAEAKRRGFGLIAMRARELIVTNDE